MFKHTFSLKALALFAGICLLALSGYGIFSSSLQGRVMWLEKPIPSDDGFVACDAKTDCDDDAMKKGLCQNSKESKAESIVADIRRRQSKEYQLKRLEESKKREEERRAQLEKYTANVREREEENKRIVQRASEERAKREAEKREIEKQAPAFRRQLKSGVYVAFSNDDYQQCRGMVIRVSPPLVEVQTFGDFLMPSNPSSYTQLSLPSRNLNLCL